jgi:transcriptional regulator PpsR
LCAPAKPGADVIEPERTLADKTPFTRPEAAFGVLDAADTVRLVMAAGDITLSLDSSGQILDIAANRADFPGCEDWIGQSFVATVTIDSRDKVNDMLAIPAGDSGKRWRQINHAGAAGDIPVRYLLISLSGGERLIAVGRDMRHAVVLQQRLLQAQQSLERDYMRLRQIETRYRLLFDLSSEPVLLVEADSQRIQEANPAAHALLEARAGSLVGTKLTALVARGSRDPLIAYLGAVLTSAQVSPLTVELERARQQLSLSATGFRQLGGRYLLVRLASANARTPEGSATLLDVVERMPDAFVVADAKMRIMAANIAFLELARVASLDQIRGRPLGEFLGRPGIDLDLIEAQLTKHGLARNVSTVVRARDSEMEEPVELSAVRTSGDMPCFGFAIREIGRRLRDLPPTPLDLPRSVEQLTELVGRASLKDIVRESTDLIERLCIEAALAYTSDNRASAAEILGLSRQSLYSKLHRYGLGNLVGEPE